MKLMQQAILLLGICILGTALSAIVPFPFPATVASMVVLFLLLVLGIVKEGWISTLCDLLTQNMAWLLVPLGANAAQTFSLWWPHWWKIMLVCITMTIPTFLVTQLTVRGVFRLQKKLGGKDKCI